MNRIQSFGCSTNDPIIGPRSVSHILHINNNGNMSTYTRLPVTITYFNNINDKQNIGSYTDLVGRVC